MNNTNKANNTSQEKNSLSAASASRLRTDTTTTAVPENDNKPSAHSRQREANTTASQVPLQKQTSGATAITTTANKGRKMIIKRKYIQKKPVSRTEEEIARETQQKLKDINEHAHLIYYGRSFFDDKYEYRNVTLPKNIARWLPRPFEQLLKPEEWLSLGVQQSGTWEHYMIYAPEPHVLLFRRNKKIYEEKLRLHQLKKQREAEEEQQQQQHNSTTNEASSNNTSTATNNPSSSSASQKPSNNSHKDSLPHKRTVLSNVNGPTAASLKRSSSNGSKYANKVRVFKPPSSAETEEEDCCNDEADVDEQIASIGVVGENPTVAHVSNMPPEPLRPRRIV